MGILPEIKIAKLLLALNLVFMELVSMISRRMIIHSLPMGMEKKNQKCKRLQKHFELFLMSLKLKNQNGLNAKRKINGTFRFMFSKLHWNHLLLSKMKKITRGLDWNQK